MRTLLDASIRISKLGIQWVAFLHIPDVGWEVLGVSEWLGDLISDSRLNSTFDRQITIFRDHQCKVAQLLNEM